MKVAAIICEYNPFHSGHKFHIEETKRITGADLLVLIMSGNFVQRGEAAIFEKSARARAAIACGGDLCLELPTVYSTASAEFFALGAVKILNALGLVDFLSFGAESADIDALSKIARLLAEEPKDFSDLIKDELSLGVSYPKARAKAISAFLGKNAEDILSSPNNILAIEYIKAIIRTKSNLVPVSIPRKGASHDSLVAADGIASASFVRDLILKGEDASLFMPDAAQSIFKNEKVHSLAKLDSAMLSEIIKMPTSKLLEIRDIAEGIENRIKAMALKANSLDELISLVKTKRYTHSRLRRIMLSAYLGISRTDQNIDPPYIRVLDYSEAGQKLLSKLKKTALLPTIKNTTQINKLKDQTAKDFWERERIFDKIYTLTEI